MHSPNSCVNVVWGILPVVQLCKEREKHLHSSNGVQGTLDWVRQDCFHILIKEKQDILKSPSETDKNFTKIAFNFFNIKTVSIPNKRKQQEEQTGCHSDTKCPVCLTYCFRYRYFQIQIHSADLQENLQEEAFKAQGGKGFHINRAKYER